MNVQTAISSIKHFSKLSEEARSELVAHSNIYAVKKGQIINLEGEHSGKISFIVEGRINYAYISHSGKEYSLMTVEKESFCGEISLSSHVIYPFNLVSLSAGTLLQIRADRFKDILRRHSAQFAFFYDELLERIGFLYDKIAELSLLETRERIQKFILDVAGREGKKLASGEIEIIRPTHQKIASEVGAARETVSRILTKMENDGFIMQDGKKLIIK